MLSISSGAREGAASTMLRSSSKIVEASGDALFLEASNLFTNSCKK